MSLLANTRKVKETTNIVSVRETHQSSKINFLRNKSPLEKLISVNERTNTTASALLKIFFFHVNRGPGKML